MRIKLTDIDITHASSGTAIHELQVELPNGKILNVYTGADKDGHLDGTVVDIENSSENFLTTWEEPLLI